MTLAFRKKCRVGFFFAREGDFFRVWENGGRLGILNVGVIHEFTVRNFVFLERR